MFLLILQRLHWYTSFQGYEPLLIHDQRTSSNFLLNLTALADVTLDRSEPWGSVESGKWGAGYAGTTLRLDPALAAAFSVRGSAGGATPAECTARETKHLEFTDPATGEGVLFEQLKAPQGARFYLWPDKRMINPSVVYTGALKLKKGETLELAYRLSVRAGSDTRSPGSFEPR